MSDFENISDFEPELDGQVYQPAPQIVPDTETGFSPNGDWHVAIEYLRGDHDPNGASLDTPHTPNFPYRLAHEIQEYVKSFEDTCDYTMGRADREDLATDFVNDHLSHEVDPASLAFDGLIHWRRMFNG